jgi:ABC-type multidrug transport system permease subunit
MAFLSLAIFYGVAGPTAGEKMGVAGALFFTSTNQLMLTFMGTILLFQNERPIFLREQSSAMYDVAPYFNAKTLAEAPMLTIIPIIFSTILYFGLGLTNTAENFFMFCFILWGLVQCSSAIGYFVSSLFNDVATASMVAPIIMMPFMLFSGFYANFDTLAAWIAWFKWVNPQKYALEAMLQNEYQFDQYENPNPANYDIIGFLHIDFPLYNAILMLVFLAIFFRISAFFALKALISRYA